MIHKNDSYSSLRDHRQDHMRRILCIVINGLRCLLYLRAHPKGIAGVLVSGKAREITAGDLQANMAPRLKFPTGLPHVNGVLVHLPWLKEAGILQRFTKAGTNNPLTDVYGPSIR